MAGQEYDTFENNCQHWIVYILRKLDPSRNLLKTLDEKNIKTLENIRDDILNLFIMFFILLIISS